MQKVKLLLIAMLTCLLFGCANTEKDPAKEVTNNLGIEEAGKEVADPEFVPEDAEEELPEISTGREVKDGKIRSLLTGGWVDEKIGKRRPVAMMLSNIEAAMPMSGISYADVVYEAPVEGELTRCMGIFERYDNLEKIGSIRSCRDYFLYYALEFDAVYAHWGQSAYAVEVLERDYVNNLSGLSAIGSTVFYRSNDRIAPHNAYASAKGIEAGIKKLKYRTEYLEDHVSKFTFAEDDKETVYEGEKYTYIAPGYYINKPWFEYNENDKLYYRFQYGDKHIDDLTGEQLAYKNVIIQYSNWQQRDERDYLAFDCHGKGYGLYFTNGTGKEVKWRRVGDVETGMIKYYELETGKEIVFNQGKTFICIVRDEIDGEMNNDVVFK